MNRSSKRAQKKTPVGKVNDDKKRKTKIEDTPHPEINSLRGSPHVTSHSDRQGYLANSDQIGFVFGTPPPEMDGNTYSSVLDYIPSPPTMSPFTKKLMEEASPNVAESRYLESKGKKNPYEAHREKLAAEAGSSPSIFDKCIAKALAENDYIQQRNSVGKNEGKNGSGGCAKDGGN